MAVTVLYEDNHLLCAYKPTGMLSQRDRTGHSGMLDEVKAYLKTTYHKKGNVFLGLVHRLDRPVSGVMVFAKTSKGASRLSEQFRNQQVEKTYHAIVAGHPNHTRGVLMHQLGKDVKTKKAKEFADGNQAVLRYETIATNRRYSLLKITIEGGKFHQIRAQLSLEGLPILGDIKYGGTPWHDPKSIALCATELRFKAATQDKMIHVAVEIPTEWQRYLSTAAS